VIQIGWKDGRIWIFKAAHGPASETAQRSVVVDGKTFEWKGNFSLEKEGVR
jgi:hypothetical protein